MIQGARPPLLEQRRAAFGALQARELDEEARRRSEAAVQAALGDPNSIGARLMTKMGYGVQGAGLGRSGQVRLGRNSFSCPSWDADVYVLVSCAEVYAF
jgi:hypothetical protein